MLIHADVIKIKKLWIQFWTPGLMVFAEGRGVIITPIYLLLPFFWDSNLIRLKEVMAEKLLFVRLFVWMKATGQFLT